MTSRTILKQVYQKELLSGMHVKLKTSTSLKMKKNNSLKMRNIG